MNDATDGPSAAATATSSPPQASPGQGDLLRQLGGLGRDAVVYGVSNLLSALALLLLLPLYTRYLAPAEYGLLELVIVTSALLALVLQGGIATALFRAVQYSDTVGADERTLISTAFYFSLGSAILGFALLAPFAPALAGVVMDDRGYALLMLCAFGKAALDCIGVVPLSTLRIRRMSGRYLVANLGRLIIAVTLVYYFLVVRDLGVTGVAAALVLESALFGLGVVVWLLPELRLAFSIRAFREMWRFGMPLVPLGFGLMILNSADRYFLQHYSSMAEVGRYAVGYKLGMIVGMAVRAFQIAWAPVMFSAARKPDAAQFFARVLTYFVLVLILLAVPLAAFAPEIVNTIATPAYHDAWRIVPLVALANVLNGVYVATTVGTNLANRTTLVMIAVLIAAAANIALNFALIPRFGSIGAALSTILSYGLMATLSCAAAVRLYPIPYEWARIAKLGAAAAVVSLVALQLPGDTAGGIMLKMLVVLTFPLLVHVLGLIDLRRVYDLARLRTQGGRA